MFDQNTETVSMDETGTQDTTPTQELCGLDIFRPLVESFFQRLTPERWRMLSAGSPDEATRIMLAELLLDIKTSMSKALLAHLKSLACEPADRYDQYMYHATDRLTQNFADTLGISDSVQSDSLKLLSDLVGKEIRESVDSALSSRLETKEPVTLQHVTPPGTLNAMVEHASEMFKALAAKMNFSLIPGFCGQRREENLKSAGSQPSVKTEELDSLESIIRKELEDITEPVLDDMSVYETLQSETSKEIVVVVEDIAEVIAKKTASWEETDVPSSSPKPKPRHKLKIVANKIKTFVAKSLAKACICCIATKVKAQVHQDTSVESGQSMQSLRDSIDSLLQPEDGESVGGNELALIPLFKQISSGKSQEVTKELSVVLHSYITNGIEPEVIPEIQTLERQTCWDSDVAVSHAITYANIEVLVLNFITLMSWWLYTQSDSHSQRVTEALMDHVTRKSASKCEEKPQTAQHKLSVKLLVEMVVWKIFLKTRTVLENKGDIIQRLFDIIWAQVEGSDLNIKSLKKLKKAIFKDLCDMSGSAEMLLLSLKLESPQLDNCIADIFKDHLTAPPKQPCAICRFFSSVGKVISKPFRRSTKVAVLVTADSPQQPV